MKYQDLLKVCKEKQAYGSQFYIAEEVQCQLQDVQEIEYTEERFEALCNCAWEAYLKSEDNNMFAICKAVTKLEAEHIKNNGKDPLEMSRYEILEEAAWC